MKEKRIFDLLTRYVQTYPEQKVALAKKHNGNWKTYSINEYIERVNLLSYALIELGIEKNDKVAIICSNCPEWNMLDMAIMQVGAITVPIYPTVSNNDYKYIINNSEAKLIVIEGNSVINKLNSVINEVPSLKIIYTLTEESTYPHFRELLQLGKDHPSPDVLQARKDAVRSDECATIIYTSGTTGTPKGVMLSHSNILNQIDNLYHTPSRDSKRAYSFLPICHSYERTLVFLYQYLGMSIYYAESLATIQTEMKEIQPTMMTCVPRLLEKIYLKVKQTGKSQKGIAKHIFLWAVNLAEQYKIEDSDRSWWYNFKLRIADNLVFKKIRKNLGAEHFDIIVSGAASIQPTIVAFFSAIKMPVFEGYGMTECSPVIAVSCRGPHGREAGVVGLPLPGVEIRVTEQNEIICRGHNVMMGYYKDPELTASVIDSDGWFHTGDLGEINQYNQVRITGRLKNLFKTSLGKYINPDLIEGLFSESGFIENIVVFGENQKYVAALIVPDFSFLKIWCQKHEIPFTKPEEMIKVKAVKDRIAAEIKKLNTSLGDTEKVKRYELIADEWTTADGSLTPTLKVKRDVIKERYKELIDRMFYESK